jgi:hypothetical protein
MATLTPPDAPTSKPRCTPTSFQAPSAAANESPRDVFAAGMRVAFELRRRLLQLERRCVPVRLTARAADYQL